MATREDLLARQEQDPGAPDDTVYVVENGGNGTDQQRKANCYHDDQDCLQLPDATEESTRAAEQRRWRGPCRSCVLGGDR